MSKLKPFMLITEMIEKSARIFPKHLALQDATSNYTYEQVCELVDNAAGFLMEAGIKKNDVVAVIAENNNYFVILMLAIFKIGGILLSVDSSIPIQRKVIMLSEAKCKWILSSDLSLVDQVFCTEYTIVLWNNQNTSENRAWPVVKLNDPACIFFTSGSTGKPKGILASHHGLSHFLTWQSSRFGINENDRCAQLTRLSFDVVLRSTLLALMNGAALIFPVQRDVANPQTLKWMIMENVTYCHVVPNLVKNWLCDLVDRVDFPSLKYLFFAGEKLDGKLINLFRQRVRTQAILINLYGPSETVLAKCYYIVPTVLEYPGIQPIGKPLPETRVEIVDNNKNICSTLEDGEIVIQTPFPILGYINDKHSILKPLGNNTKNQFYFTGDVGTQDENGLLLIKGRKDEQFKINGTRIEFGEIEFALEQYPGIEKAAVYIENDNIIACIKSRNDCVIKKHDLLTFIDQYLPNEMQPKQFKIIEQFPHTQSGKLDRNKLSMISSKLLTTDIKNIHKETKLGKQLGDIFNKVLNTVDIKPDDNFFDLGIDSLSAARIANLIYDKTHCALDVIDIYKYNTIYKLEHYIHKHSSKKLLCDPVSQIRKKYSFKQGAHSLVPLSLQQQQFAFYQNCHPTSPAYNVNYCFEFSTPLNHSVLKRSIAALMKKYPILNIDIRYHNKCFKQKTNPEIQPPITILELSGEQSATALINKLCNEPFHLNQSPLFRVTVIEKKNRSIILFTIHHIITDGLSSRVLLDEVEYYFRLCGTTKKLPKIIPDTSYFDYCTSHVDDQCNSTMEFWQNKLNDFQFTELPHDYPDNQSMTMISNNGKTKRYIFPLMTKARLVEFSRENSVTEFSVLFCVFGILLSRYAAQQDITIGVPFQNRLAQYEKSLGCFVNTLPIRFTFDTNKSFSELCKEVNYEIASIIQHQGVSLPELIRQLKLSGNIYKNPLFEILFSYEVNAKQQLDLGGNLGKCHSVTNKVAKFELSFMISANLHDKMFVDIEYNCQLFDKLTIDQLYNRYYYLLITLLQCSTTNPIFHHIKCQDILQFNENIHTYDGNSILAEIENNYKLFPSNIAIYNGKESLTYERLWSNIQLLAYELQQQNISNKEIITVLIPRGQELITAMLAIWYVGCIYLPLDPDLPLDRLNVIMADAKPVCLIINDAELHDHPVLVEYKNPIKIITFYIDDRIQVTHNVKRVPISLNDPAYLLYTSGTTGRPKGVVQTHKTLINLFHEQTMEISNVDELRVTQMASSLFDVSLQEIIFCLGKGGALYILPSEYKLQPDKLWSFLLTNKINVVFLPPALLQLLAEFRPELLNHNIKYFITSGEALVITPTIKSLMVELCTCHLINQYGPTETHVASVYCLPMDVSEWGTHPPIGKPIANTYFAVVDANINYLPIGMKGELYIAGDGLAIGYFNDDELTRKKFVYLKVDNELHRFYRTGDMVVQKNDGEYYFYGRRDKQLSIRGYRVEPAEIEYQILSHPQVTNCYVLTRKNQTQVIIIAFYKTKKHIQITDNELKQLLTRSLPVYMHPQYYIHLENFPTNANGKIDISQLPMPTFSVGHILTHECSPLQREIIYICKNNLNIAVHSIDDNLLQSGFDSLSMATLVATINQSYKCNLSIIDAFNHPTIRSLSGYIKLESKVSLPNAGSHQLKNETFFNVSYQQNRILNDIKRGQNPVANNLSICLQLTGTLDESAMKSAILSMMKQYDVFRHFMQVNENRNVIYVHKTPMIKLKIMDYTRKTLTTNDIKSVLESKLHENLYPFAKGFYRIYLIKTKPNEYYFLLVIHHLCFDGTSTQIFQGELARRYTHFLTKQKVLDLDGKKISADYQKYSNLQKQNDSKFNENINYYNRILNNVASLMYIPVKSKHVNLYDNTKSHIFFEIENNLLTDLRNTAQINQTTLFTLFLHAYFMLIRRCTSNSKIIVGTTVNGRIDFEFEDTLGLFSQRTLLTSDAPTNDVDSIKETRNNISKCLQNQTLSLYDYPKHQYYINDKNVATPQFNIIFQNYMKVSMSMPQLSIKEIHLENKLYSLDVTDITFVINEASNAMTIEVVYQEKIHSTDFIRKLEREYLSILNELVSIMHSYNDS